MWYCNYHYGRNYNHLLSLNVFLTIQNTDYAAETEPAANLHLLNDNLRNQLKYLMPDDLDLLYYYILFDDKRNNPLAFPNIHSDDTVNNLMLDAHLLMENLK